MRLERAIEELKSRRPAWDDLTQRRLLNEVHAARGRAVARSRKRAVGVLVVVAVAAGLGLGIWGASGLGRAPQPEVSSSPATAAVETPRRGLGAGQSVLSLADGSRAVLEEGSVVDTQVQTKELVRLSQRRGRVRYEVTPDPGRVFVVHAGAYQVRVLGTVFSVEVTTDRLHVAVERGRVEVGGAERTLVLEGGERVDLPRTRLEGMERVEGAEASVGDADVPDAPDGPVEDVPSSGREIPPPSATVLLQKADSARRAGRLREAANALRSLVRTHKRDSRVPSAWFMLGRVERQRGNHGAAARAFRRAGASASSGALAEDARAEEALSWHRAGVDTRAREAARAYLESYPMGTHRSRVRAIVR